MTKQPGPNPDFSELEEHLKDLTNALTAVHGDLYWLAMQTPYPAEKQSPAADLSVDLLTDLKTAVDDMRLLLWKYIETASETDPQKIQDRFDSQRLHRVTRFLELLRDRLASSQDDQPVSFIERISAAMKKRLGEKAA